MVGSRCSSEEIPLLSLNLNLIHRAEGQKLVSTKKHLVLITILLASTLGCGGSGNDHTLSGPLPNVVLVSIDTLRADYFSAEHMPLSFGWAERNGVLCTRAYANSTWTLPSHVTLLTGLLPREHGVEYRGSRVPPELPTIPAVLRELGYYSFAFTNSGYVSKHIGMAEHFDKWDQVNNEPSPLYFQTLLQPFERSKKVLARERSEPLFVLLHTYFVHEYYIDDSDFAGHDFVTLKEWNKYRIDKAHRFGKAHRQGDPESAVAVRDMYAAKVRQFDSYLYGYLCWLETTPLADNLSVILTSDHGEGLFEDRDGKTVYGHCGAPYPERVRIPLSFSGLEPGQRDDLISLRDLSGVIENLARHGELSLPELATIETEFLTAEREDAVKIRHSSIVSADGTWTLEQGPGSSLDDSRKVAPIDKHHFRQLKILGYLE